MPVRLGIYLDLRNPPEWQTGWRDHYARCLALAEEADHLGLGAIWLTEHHGFEDGYLTQPLTMAAAVAARTRQARIGTGVVLAALRHPRHLAEEAVVVDLVSGGRLELGLGAGYRAAEYADFGVDMAARFDRTDAVAMEVRRLLAGDASLTPPPLQQPLPLWLGYQGPLGARRVGRLGMGLLSLRRHLLEPYRDGLAEGGHDPGSARMGGLVDLVVADDPPAALERILPHYAYQADSYRRYAVPPGAPRPRPLTVEDVRARHERRGALPGLRVVDPDGAIAAVREATDGLPVHHAYAWATIAAMPDDLAARHVELLATRVAPAVATVTGAPAAAGADAAGSAGGAGETAAAGSARPDPAEDRDQDQDQGAASA